MAPKKENMSTTSTIELYKSTAKFLEDLNGQLLGRVYEAIKKVEDEQDEYFNGLRDWLRAPFGLKPTGIEAIEHLQYLAGLDKETVSVYEHVLMGSSIEYKYPIETIRLIVKYL